MWICRCLVVYKNDANEFRTARTYPRMVLIEISVHDEDHIAVNAPGMRELYVKLPINGEGEERNIRYWAGTKFFEVTLKTRFRLWNESIPTIDCGDEAATWFSRYILDSPDGLRLGFNLNKSRRDLISTNPSLVKQFKNIDNSSGVVILTIFNLGWLYSITPSQGPVHWFVVVHVNEQKFDRRLEYETQRE